MQLKRFPTPFKLFPIQQGAYDKLKADGFKLVYLHKDGGQIAIDLDGVQCISVDTVFYSKKPDQLGFQVTIFLDNQEGTQYWHWTGDGRLQKVLWEEVEEEMVQCAPDSPGVVSFTDPDYNENLINNYLKFRQIFKILSSGRRSPKS